MLLLLLLVRLATVDEDELLKLLALLNDVDELLEDVTLAAVELLDDEVKDASVDDDDELDRDERLLLGLDSEESDVGELLLLVSDAAVELLLELVKLAAVDDELEL